MSCGARLPQIATSTASGVDDLSIGNHRRYCYAKYRYWLPLDYNQALAWDGKRRTIAGTDIPASFPARSALLAAGYLVLEEIEGANSTELIDAGLTAPQAAAVLAAME